MKKNIIYIIVIILMVLTAAFYWYELRPSLIIEKCSLEYRTGLHEIRYKKCLSDNGIIK